MTGKRGSVRRRMVDAAAGLFRRQGYNGTAMADVLGSAGAPRGSVYFHFPDGKVDLAIEVLAANTASIVHLLNLSAARRDSAADIVMDLVDHFRTVLVRSKYADGCAVALIALETAAVSEPLRQAAARAFGDWQTAFSERLVEKGVPSPRARKIAMTSIGAIEGALMLARTLRTTEPLDGVADHLIALLEAPDNELASTGRSGA